LIKIYFVLFFFQDSIGSVDGVKRGQCWIDPLQIFVASLVNAKKVLPIQKRSVPI